MKNGDQRSEAWIKRNLPTYTRDNADRTPSQLQDMLSLVIEDLLPSLETIGAWTPTERMLADDWASNVHFSASDNNNRVPAIPEHLKPYRRVYPQRTAEAVARAAIAAMGADSGACFHPTEAQVAQLQAGILCMQGAGCFFTEAEIELWAGGEHGEMLAHFQKFDGFEKAQEAMCQIFEELDDSGQVKSDEQRAADAKRHHDRDSSR